MSLQSLLLFCFGLFPTRISLSTPSSWSVSSLDSGHPFREWSPVLGVQKSHSHRRPHPFLICSKFRWLHCKRVQHLPTSTNLCQHHPLLKFCAMPQFFPCAGHFSFPGTAVNLQPKRYRKVQGCGRELSGQTACRNHKDLSLIPRPHVKELDTAATHTWNPNTGENA